jgi:hypothetical protein
MNFGTTMGCANIVCL